MSSLRDKIFAIDDKARKPVVVPEWNNTTVYVRMLSAAEMNGVLGAKGDLDWARLLILGVVDESGAQVFSQEDTDAIGKRCNKAVRTLLDAILDINKLGSEATSALVEAFPE